MVDEVKEFKKRLQHLFPMANPLEDQENALLLENANPEIQQWIKSMGTNIGVNLTSDGNLSISFPRELQKDGKQISYSDAFPEKYMDISLPDGPNFRVLQGGDGKPIIPEMLQKELDRKELIADIYRTVREQRDEYRLLYEYEDHKVLASFSDCLYAGAKRVRLIGPDGHASEFNMSSKDTKQNSANGQTAEQDKVGDHLYVHDMNVTILNPDGSATVVPLHENPENLPESFAWVKESFGKLATEWDKIAAGEERALLDNFRQQGGILSLMQKNADKQKLLNAASGGNEETFDDFYVKPDENNNPTVVTVTTGQASWDLHDKDIEFIIALSTERSSTDLLHELTHVADFGISESPLFVTCLQLDRSRGGKTFESIDNFLRQAIEKGTYRRDETPDELICRLNEVRHANPEQFKKECPLLDAFYSKVFYSALTAQTIAVNPDERIGNREAANILGNSRLLYDEITPLNSWNAQELINDKNIEKMVEDLTTETDPKKRAEIQSSLNNALDKNPYVQSIYQKIDELHQDIINLQEKTKLEHRKSWKNHGILLGADGVNYWVPTDDNGHLIVPEYLQHRYQDSNNQLNESTLQADKSKEAAHIGVSFAPDKDMEEKGGLQNDTPLSQPNSRNKSISNHDLLGEAANGGQGQGEAPMDKHNGLDYRNIHGKDHNPLETESIPPTNSLEDVHHKKAEEIRKNLGLNNPVAVKRGYSL